MHLTTCFLSTIFFAGSLTSGCAHTDQSPAIAASPVSIGPQLAATSTASESGPPAEAYKPPEKPTQKVKLPTLEGDEVEFKLEIAADDQGRQKGLSGRDKIDEHGGMLFCYPRPGYRGFWMWNCLIDIDLIYLDAKGRIINWHEMKKEPPRKPGEAQWKYESRLPRYRSKRPAQFVIELKSGWIDKLKLKELQEIEFDREKWEAVAKKLEERDSGW